MMSLSKKRQFQFRITGLFIVLSGFGSWGVYFFRDSPLAQMGLVLASLIFGWTISLVLIDRHTRSTSQNPVDPVPFLKDLIPTLVHDIRNPLTIIVGYVEQIQLKQEKGLLDTDTLNKCLEKIQSGAEKILDLLNRMSKFRRASPRMIADVSLKSLVEKALVDFPVKNFNVMVVNNVEDLKIWADPESITKTIVIVIKNACQAMVKQETRVLTLSANEDDTFVNLEVLDTGPGISSEDLKNIFKPFYSKSEASDSLGLGLCQARGFLTKNFGSLLVESQPQQGTRIKISLLKQDPALPLVA